MEKKNKPKKIVLMIDPPFGSKFGFPKKLPKRVKDIRGWLVENGYPKQIIEDAGDSFQYRFFEIEIQ